MNTYIKHSEDDSLTHYGIKGMKWRKGRKTGLHLGYNEEMTQLLREEAERQNAIRAGKKPPAKSAAYREAERRSNRRKKIANSIKTNRKRVSGLLSNAKKTGSRTLNSSKKAVSKGYKKLNNIATKFAKKNKKKKSSSSNKKHHKMSNALQMERARYAMKESRRLNNGLPTRSRARTIIRYKNY